MAELPLKYLRKFTVSRKLARPIGPGRMRTARSLAHRQMARNRRDSVYVPSLAIGVNGRKPIRSGQRVPGRGGIAMKKLLLTALLSTVLISCHATARFYPVRGPLAEQPTPPVLVGRISGVTLSGTMTVNGLQGELF